MSFKDSVNAKLQRVTGYRLTKETPAQRQEALAAAAKRARENTAERHRKRAAAREERRLAQQKRRQEQQKARRQAERARRRLEREEQEAAARASGADLPDRLDPVMRTTITKARPRTMTSPAKLETLIEATRYVVANKIPGEVVECGVWRGGSMQAIALTLLDLDAADRELHLFDTYEGMPPPTEEDARVIGGQKVGADELLAKSDRDSRMWAIAGLDDVAAGMAETGYPENLVHLHQGMVEETTPGLAPEKIAILRLDTDWYASTKHELEHLWDRLSPGGVLLLDDYGDWEGARKATEEWLAKTGIPLFLAPMDSGRVAVKPVEPS